MHGLLSNHHQSLPPLPCLVAIHVCVQASLAFGASSHPAYLAMPLPSFHSRAECLVNVLFAVSSAMGPA